MTPAPAPPTLDFAGIRSRCPLAFAALIAYHFVNFPKDQIDVSMTRFDPEAKAWFYEGLEDNPRDLYDFFDQQGVYVVVTWGAFTREYSYELNAGVPLGFHPTRAEAEAAGFEAAFARLEEMLKQGQGCT